MQSKNIILVLYKKLIGLYPQGFKEQFNESMQQTFNDLYKENQNTNQSLFNFVTWTFLETTIGIIREHLLHGGIMQSTLKSFGLSALISFLINLPFLIMEIINRRQFNEEFPFFLFFALWLNVFAVVLLVMPILRTKKQELTNQNTNTLLTNPKSSLLISILLFIAPGIFPLLNYLGWVNIDRLFNGPNPEVAYIPGLILTIVLIAFPISSGVVAGKPIINTLQSGGRWFAHPIHLIIVGFIAFTFASGVISLIIDQWPCFIGVPVCD